MKDDELSSIDPLAAQEIQNLRALVKKYESGYNTLNQILSELPGHIYWLDADNIVLGCNDVLAKITGLQNREDAVGKHVSLFLTKEEGEVVLRNNAKVMKEGTPLIDEEAFTTQAGELLYFLSRKAPLRDKNGEIIGTIGTSLDITDLKKAQEKAVEALKQKAQAEEELKRALLIFSGMQNHDLRAPLSSVHSRSYFIKKHISTLINAYKIAFEANKEEIPVIKPKTLSELEQVPDDILQALYDANSYIEASLKSIKGASLGEEFLRCDQLVNCNIEHLLSRIIDKYPCDEEQKKLIHFNTVGSFNFKGNQIFFNRLVENLIRNAFEQIQLKGKGEIFIGCEPGDPYNYLKIKDTAGGVDPKHLGSIFEGFNSSKKGGTGLGLSSAKPIMQAFGGDISCHRVEGDCIEFCLSFPLVYS